MLYPGNDPNNAKPSAQPKLFFIAAICAVGYAFAERLVPFYLTGTTAERTHDALIAAIAVIAYRALLHTGMLDFLGERRRACPPYTRQHKEL